MTAPWRQIVAQDPNPSNQTTIAGNLWVHVIPATLAGNPLLVHSNIANLVGNKVTGVTQMVAGSGTAFTKIDELLNPGSPPGNSANGGCAGAIWHLPNPVAMNGGDKGTTTAGSTTSITDSSKSGVWTTNQWAGKWVKVYNRNQIAQVTSSTSTGVLNFNSGSISAASGDNYVVGDWLEFAVTGSDDYNADIVIELDATQGIPTTAIGSMHSAQQPASGSTITAGTDAISTGSANLGTGTVVQIGFFEDDVDNASPFVPNVGSSGTSGGTFYVFNLGAPIMRVIYRTLTNPSVTDMKATAQATDHFQAFMVGFQTGAAASQAQALQFVPGPGVSPLRRFQFQPALRGIVLPLSVLSGFAGYGAVNASFSLSSLSTSGGLGFIPRPGPGLAEPFNLNQFLPSPQSVVSPQAAFLAAMQDYIGVNFTATLSSLQATYAVSAGDNVSMTASLQTLSTSGGLSYLPQPGPGISPSAGMQFQAQPFSTNLPFQQLSGSFTAYGGFATSFTLATGLNLLWSPSALSSATMTLTSGIQLAEIASAATSATLSVTTTITPALAAAAATQSQFGLQTGIVLAETAVSAVSMTSGLGNIAMLSFTAAGAATTSFGLSSAMPLTVAAYDAVGASLQLTGGIVLAAPAAASTSTGLGLSATIVFAAQPAAAATMGANLTAQVTPAAAAAGSVGALDGLATAIQMAQQASAGTSASFALTTNVTTMAVIATAVGGVTTQLVTGINLAMAPPNNVTFTAGLLTVLAPPSDFSDVNWVRAPRSNPPQASGPMPYAEFYQAVGERLWYAIAWQDWLANRWEANMAVQAGQAIQPSTPNGLQAVCTTAGQSGAVEPAWPAYANGSVLDGTAVWTMQAISTSSLEDTLQSCTWSAASPQIALSSGQIGSGQITFVQIDTTAAVPGTDYDVLNTVDTTDGQQKIGKIRVKVQ